MTPKGTPLLLLLSSFTILWLAAAQDRAPHGLAYENPMAFSPSAYDFFHPSAQQTNKNAPCRASGCSPLPMAAQVAEDAELKEGGISNRPSGGNRLGAGATAGIVIGLAIIVVSVVGIYHVIATRRANIHRANCVKPESGCQQSV